jgi:hypothetical protein
MATPPKRKPTIEDARKAERQVAEQLRKLRKITRGQPDGRTELEREAARARTRRASTKDVLIPPCADPRRRKRLEKSDEKWLRWYFPDLFWYAFTFQQKAMIAMIRTAIRYGGDQSLAASRGEGKTKIAERMELKSELEGVISFGVIFAATGSAAQDSLDSIKGEIESNDRLCDDYPEVCVPVRALENTPNRAHYQTVSGKRHDSGEPFERAPSRFSWCGHEIILPNVPGSPSASAIMATRGLDAAVRGLNKKNRRVDLAIIDDPETEDTVRSEEQAKKLEERIDRAIAGLGGQQRSIARVMLTTLQRRECVSAWFTDPAKKPSWKGKRFRFLLTPPTRADLWDEYVQLRQANQQAQDEDGNFTDPFARGAHKFYLKNRKKMEAGAKVANRHRFDAQLLADGSKLEVSALQRYYNEVARLGADAVACEYDNDPPEESGPIMASGVTAHRIQTRLSGYPRRIVPPGCTVLTQGIDLRKPGGHFVVRAWQPDATGYTIDYGFQESHGTTYGSDDGLEKAIVQVIRDRMEEVRSNPYTTVDGEVVDLTLTLVDSGWQSAAVYHVCQEVGGGILPAKGFGKSNGCAQPNFRAVWKLTPDRRPGDGWFLQRQPRGVWLACLDTDRWKEWEHARWLTPVGKPGAMTIFGETHGEGGRLSKDEREHHSYGHHIAAESIEEEEVKGMLVRKWKAKNARNHYFDASYMADAAAGMKGIVLFTVPKRDPAKRPSMEDLKKRAG